MEIEQVDDHVMIDIESMGLKYNSIVASLGVVRFNPTIGRVQTIAELRASSTRIHIKISDSIKNGFKIDGETLTWWLKQSDEARGSLVGHEREEVSPALALLQLSSLFKKDKKDYVWGNGPSFDMTLLEAYYEAMSIEIPWDFRRVMCYRTTKLQHYYDKSLVPKIEIAHDPVDDAIRQVQVLQAIAVANPQLKWRKS